MMVQYHHHLAGQTLALCNFNKIALQLENPMLVMDRSHDIIFDIKETFL